MDPEPENDEEDIELLKKKNEAADPCEPRLKPISLDRHVVVSEGSK